jgi:serine/threonine protein kinase, bacterial
MPSPGWYADPAGNDRLRYFNGHRWTDYVDRPARAAEITTTTPGTGIPAGYPAPIPGPASATRGKRTRWILIGSAALAVVVVVGGLGTGLALHQLLPRLRQTVLPFTGLREPQGLAVDSAGTAYVTDFGNNRVLKLPAGASTSSTLPFTGLNGPGGVAVDTAGAVYVVDSFNNRVLKLAAGASTQIVLPLTGLALDGWTPPGVAVDPTGNVYVTDQNNNRVLMLATRASTQTVLPFTGLNRPAGVAIDAFGDVYVADARNHRVLKLPAGASTHTVLPFSPDYEPAEGLTVDPAGTVYVTSYRTDPGSWGCHVFNTGPCGTQVLDRVLKLPAGATIPSALPFTGLKNATGIAVDSAGNVYVADIDNDRVLKLAPS